MVAPELAQGVGLPPSSSQWQRRMLAAAALLRHRRSERTHTPNLLAGARHSRGRSGSTTAAPACAGAPDSRGPYKAFSSASVGVERGRGRQQQLLFTDSRQTRTSAPAGAGAATILELEIHCLIAFGLFIFKSKNLFGQYMQSEVISEKIGIKGRRL